MDVNRMPCEGGRFLPHSVPTLPKILMFVKNIIIFRAQGGILILILYSILYVRIKTG